MHYFPCSSWPTFLKDSWASTQQEGQLYPSTDLSSPISSGDRAEDGAQSLLDLEEPSIRARLEDIEFGLD